MKEATARIRSLSAQHHLAVDPDALTGTLPIGVQQRVEILKLLYRDARILILDEPTAVLTPPEKDRLFAVLRSLRDQGRSIILVTRSSTWPTASPSCATAASSPPFPSPKPTPPN
jgi:simple sugar transport system ATP-binding protein